MQPFENALDLGFLHRDWREPLTLVTSAICETLARQNLTVWAGHDLETVSAVQRNSHGRMRLAECVNPELNPTHGESDTLVIALRRQTEIVGCTAIRYRMLDGSLADGIVNGTALCDRVPANHRMVCNADDFAGHDVQDSAIAWSGGSFIESSAEPEAFPGMMRLAFVAALARFHWQWLCGMCELDLGGQPWSFRRLGMRKAESTVLRVEGSRRTPYALVGMRRKQLRLEVERPEYADLSIPLGLPRVPT